jgi:hypothetical protein
MVAVEITIKSECLPARMDEVRRWLSQRGCLYKLASTVTSDERVVVVEFASSVDADEFARRFDGSLVAGWMG